MKRPVALLAMLVVAGCAGGDRGGEFAREANAVCSEHRAEVEELRRPGVLELFEDYTDDVLPLLRAQRKDVAALEPPDGDAGGVRRLLAAWGDVIAAVEDLRERARAGSDIGVAIGLRQAAAAERKADPIARQLELDACVGFNPFTP